MADEFEAVGFSSYIERYLNLINISEYPIRRTYVVMTRSYCILEELHDG